MPDKDFSGERIRRISVNPFKEKQLRFIFKVTPSILGVAFLIVVSTLAACSGGTQAQTFKVGVVVTAPAMEAYFDGFKTGLTELGYVEGKNLTYIYAGPKSEQDTVSIIQNLLEQNVDLIFAVGEPAALQAQKLASGTNLSIIFAPILDPVELGLVESIATPGGNVTGVQLGNFTGKRLEWLKKVAPHTKRVLVLHDPAFRSLWMEGLKQSAPALGLEIVRREVHSKEELIAVLTNISEEVDAIFLLPDALLFANRDLIINAAIEHKLPLTVTNNAQVEEGGLLAFGVDRQAVGKQAARMADQVFKGINPGELPVETAEAIGLDLPDEILEQANTIIR